MTFVKTRKPDTYRCAVCKIVVRAPLGADSIRHHCDPDRKCSGCVKAQDAMNAIIPHSGDVAATMIDVFTWGHGHDIGRWLHGETD